MTASPVFLDTNAWLALVDKNEDNHENAVKLWEEIGRRRRPLVLTDWIIAEAGNSLAKPPFRSAFLSLLEDILSYPRVDLVFIDRKLLARATELYADRADKAWGLVACASFVIMGDLGIREVLTADHHFEQAGFRTLIRGSKRLR